MTDRNDMINQIETELGSEGSRPAAEKLFERLKDEGVVVFDADEGFSYAPEHEDGARWAEILEEMVKAGEI